MATFRIHEDQENRGSKLGDIRVDNGGNQKRTVLGVLAENKRVNGKENKEKQPFAPTNLKGLNNAQNKENKWENSKKENNRKNIVNPIIPVAQFEAFKVYEDAAYESKLEKFEERVRARSTSNVYKGTAEDRFVTKREVAEMERKGLIPKQVPKRELSPIPSPMSLEKDYDENNYSEELLKKNLLDDNFYNVEEYIVDIYRYLREHELRNRAKPTYMKKQPDVTASMRSILVDWLVEVAEEYKLHTETLYLSVNYVDRFLSYMSVVRGKLQLVGTAAMFLASKYEEVYPPDISEFVYITDDTYTKKQVIRMEYLIVKVLGFDLSVPTPFALITAMCTMNNISEKPKFLAMYLCELSMLEGETYLCFLPSQLSASAIAIAHHTLELPMWPTEIAEGIGYQLSELQECMSFLYKVFVKAPNHPQHSIQDKYKSAKYLQVSQIAAPAADSINAALGEDLNLNLSEKSDS
uniref:Cyclin N-terminal domain-containing protein n=2 Tax=Dendroctonus ponderosae TaxID=77166 RepID=A0AAR5P4W5_DENPD